MPFLDSLDIANRAMQICEQTQIASPTEDSKNNLETAFAYDKLRRAELQRNVWTFATKKAAIRAIDTTTKIIQPSAYSSGTTYARGAIVSDTNGALWLSSVEENTNNAPGGNNNSWDAYFGPLTVTLWSSTISYYAGELVYMATPTGSFTIYQSLITGNTSEPDVATAWDATVTYDDTAVVSHGGSQWLSLIPVNLNNTPATGPLAFDIGATYAAANTVTGSDHFIYSSVGSGNVGHDPVTDGGVHWTNTGAPNAWVLSPTPAVSALSWLPIAATMTALTFSYPIGSGPSSQSFTRNVFRKPAGYLRMAPQNPKAGAVSILGSPTGEMYNDWYHEGNYITSMSPDIIVLRFVADVTKVIDMTDMFCEGLALRCALAVSPTLQQDKAKRQEIADEYKKMMGEARMINAIEKGAEQPPADDYITTRL